MSLDQPLALTVDGQEQTDQEILLVNDGLTHYATLSLRRPTSLSEASPLCA
jgi:hypothetical protein